MELGIIGLGRMGANMTERLVLGGHRLISFDRSPEAIQRVRRQGRARRALPRRLQARLRSPRK